MKSASISVSQLPLHACVWLLTISMVSRAFEASSSDGLEATPEATRATRQATVLHAVDHTLLQLGLRATDLQ
jgi:hypothetical protein